MMNTTQTIKGEGTSWTNQGDENNVPGSSSP